MDGGAKTDRVLRASHVSAIARLFSPGVIKDFEKKGCSPLFSRLLVDSGLTETLDTQNRVGDVFDVAFSFLKERQFRHEYVYRAALVHKVLLGIHSLNTATMLNEFRVGSNKADVVILNGTSAVYEIKSERDKLDRILDQIYSYRRVFALTNVIVGENHVPEVIGILPKTVGVLVLSDRFQISTVREAARDTAALRSAAIFDVLRRDEARMIVELAGIAVPDVPNTQEYAVLRKIFDNLFPSQVHRGMVEVLQTTRSQKNLKQFVEAVPESLRAAVLSAELHPRSHPRILAALDSSIEEALAWA